MMDSEPQPVLHAEHLAKHFVSGGVEIPVLCDVSLAVFPGKSVSIRGESGSGKTTLLNILSRMETPDKGTLAWMDRQVEKVRASSLAAYRGRFMGMVFQSYYLVPELNSLENVLLAAKVAGLRPDRERAEALLSRVGLKERLKANPTTLSGGERQRVAVARALMNHPKMLLADEPTGNLDEHSGSVVMDMLMAVCAEEGASLVLVTHNKAFAARTDSRLRLAEGVLHAE
jgi:predicted ABC-type transport system involved in lysophospholipase L1 biosynthesis ATPase subunit